MMTWSEWLAPVLDPVLVWVAGELRFCPAGLWYSLEGPHPPYGFQNDGCTASFDRVLRRQIWPACVVHDWHYSPDGPDLTRREADRIFLRNLWRCHRWYGAGRVRAGWWAMKYFLAVRKLGRPFFKRRS